PLSAVRPPDKLLADLDALAVAQSELHWSADRLAAFDAYAEGLLLRHRHGRDRQGPDVFVLQQEGGEGVHARPQPAALVPQVNLGPERPLLAADAPGGPDHLALQSLPLQAAHADAGAGTLVD